MKMKHIIRIFSILLIIFVICPSFTVSAKEAGSVYDTYIYGNDTTTGDGDPIKIPDVYSVKDVLYGEELGVGGFRELTDIFFGPDGKLYLSDCGNGRICIFDKNFKLLKEMKEFDNNGTADAFSSPTGVFVNEEIILVCDSGKSRILQFSVEDHSLQKVFSQPEIKVLNDSSGSYTYTPEKAVMDRAGRLYVIADGINQGIIRLDQEGEFISFIGAPSVVPKLSELIWRKFATKEQRKRMTLYVPTEYDSLLIDEDGFLYATSKTSETEAFVRLNSKGENILPEIEFFGDSSLAEEEGQLKPYFADVAVDAGENAYLLDSKQGKVYLYNKEGQLLCAFGANSLQKGTFYTASAIEVFDNKMIVVDRNKSTISIFELTDFGKTIMEANSLFNAGENDKAKEAFVKLRQMCSSYLPALVSISFIDIQNGEYGHSLELLKQIRNHKDYSTVFKKLRDNFIRDYFPQMLLCMVVLVIVIILMKKAFSKSQVVAKIKQVDLYQKYKYSKYTMFHPFDAFWDIKHEKRGDLKTATLLLALFTILYGVRAQYSGYVVTKTISSEENALFSCLMILLPLAFAIIANWCLTTLMDGKGTMKDIYIVVCYSLRPYITFSIPLFIMSHVLTGEEAMFYTVFDSIALIWVLGLIFFGWLVVHDYSLSKGILSVIGTLIGICLIIFMLLLAISVIQNISSFALDLYKELSLRTYS